MYHTGHADASVLPDAVQARAIVLAWARSTLIDILLTAWSCVASAAVALEGAVGIHTVTTMLAWIGT